MDVGADNLMQERHRDNQQRCSEDIGTQHSEATCSKKLGRPCEPNAIAEAREEEPCILGPPLKL